MNRVAHLTTMNAIVTRLAFAVAAIALFFGLTAGSAHAEERHKASWMAIGVEYMNRHYKNIDSGNVKGDGEQPFFVIAARGIEWRPTNSTALGHMSGLNLDFTAGVIGAPRGFTPAVKDDTVLVLGVKAGTPWMIHDTERLRFGIGAGFGIIYELGAVDIGMGDFAEIDFDFHGNAIVGFYPTGDRSTFGLEGSYDYAFISPAYDRQHRFRGTVTVSRLALGIRYEIADVVGEGDGNRPGWFYDLGFFGGFVF